MENQKKIIDWVLINKDILKIEVIYLNGLKKYIPEIFDIEIMCTFEGKQFLGRGTDFNEEIAFVKAVSENIERIAVEKYQINSTNGLAAHTDKNLAMLNARNELIERDAFLMNFLIENKLKKIEINLEFFKKINGVEINFYSLSQTNIGSAIMCIADGRNFSKPFGIVSGSAFNENEMAAIRSSYFEVMRTVIHLVEVKENDSIDIEEFKTLSTKNFIDHGRLALDLNYANSYLDKIDNPKLDIKLTYLENNFTFKELSLDFLPADLPLILIQAKNSNLQDLYTGETKVEKINLKRIRDVTNIAFENISLNPLPHPFD